VKIAPDLKSAATEMWRASQWVGNTEERMTKKQWTRWVKAFYRLRRALDRVSR
jgi:hypothetical protein